MRGGRHLSTLRRRAIPTARDPARATALRTWRTQHGAIPGPMEVWLAHRSLATLPFRVTRQCATAQALATSLASHSPVTAVHYPGLPAHPGHAIAKGQMDAFGSVVSFELASRDHAETIGSMGPAVGLTEPRLCDPSDQPPTKPPRHSSPRSHGHAPQPSTYLRSGDRSIRHR